MLELKDHLVARREAEAIEAGQDGQSIRQQFPVRLHDRSAVGSQISDRGRGRAFGSPPQCCPQRHRRIGLHAQEATVTDGLGGRSGRTASATARHLRHGAWTT